MLTREMKERILRQLTLKPRELIYGESIKNNSGLWGNGKGLWGKGSNTIGDVTDIYGQLEITGDLSRFVGCVTGIKGSGSEIRKILEKAHKVVKHRAI